VVRLADSKNIWQLLSNTIDQRSQFVRRRGLFHNVVPLRIVNDSTTIPTVTGRTLQVHRTLKQPDMKQMKVNFTRGSSTSTRHKHFSVSSHPRPQKKPARLSHVVVAERMEEK
jgi:hypothetical protein